MTASFDATHQHRTIIFLDESDKSWQFTSVAATSTPHTEEDTTGHLTLHLTPTHFQSIQKAALFHLKPELQEPLAGANFNAEDPIEIALALNPQLLDLLAEQRSISGTLAAYLSTLSQNLSTAPSFAHPSEIPIPDAISETSTAPSPLLQTQNWFALHIKQLQASGETGYQTLWAYLSSAVLSQEIATGGKVSEAVSRSRRLSEANQLAAEASLTDAVDELLQELESWTEESLLPATKEAVEEISDALADAFETWFDSDPSAPKNSGITARPIYQAAVQFFTEDDWGFTKLKGDYILQLAFQGKHGQWNCFAVARDEAAQFLFYSVCPVAIPEDRRLAIAEFIARANYGLTLGSFEFDFDNGEIRFKTGIDVTHIKIQTAIIRQLVYANVALMDRYLPGILAVIETAAPPKNAIQAIERAETDSE